jgi:Xaa-Pro aminopeptidase
VQNGARAAPVFPSIRAVAGLVLSTIVLLRLLLSGGLPLDPRASWFSASDDNPFAHLRAHCANSTPISSHTFLARQQALAQVLHHEHLGAYIAEPGASATYFANISAREWDTSERVFLVVVTPVVSEDGEVDAQVSVLAPKFEEDRARLLEIPSKRPVRYVTWAEEQSPYRALMKALGEDVGIITADEAIRLFVSEGLKDVRLDVKMAPPFVRALRERKGDEELALMRCANEVSVPDKEAHTTLKACYQVTVLAIRAVRERMHIGIRESEVGRMMDLALDTAGLTGTFALVQFGGTR